MTIAGPRPVTPAGILAASLERVCAQLAGSGADPEVLAELEHACELAAGLEPYVEACTSPESPALTALATRTAAEDWSQRFPPGSDVPLEREMLSGHVEGKALQFLVRLAGARRVLEIGMFTGYSALAMAEALPADGSVVALELDPYVAGFARTCFAASPAGWRIDVRVGPAADSLRALAAAGDRFDLVFLDADKVNYGTYLDLVLDGDLLAPGGMVIVDNTLLQGLPWLPGNPGANGAAIGAFNAAVATDPRLEQVVLPVRDGLTLIRRVADRRSADQPANGASR